MFSMLILFTDFLANSNTLHGTEGRNNSEHFVFLVTFDRNHVRK